MRRMQVEVWEHSDGFRAHVVGAPKVNDRAEDIGARTPGEALARVGDALDRSLAVFAWSRVAPDAPKLDELPTADEMRDLLAIVDRVVDRDVIVGWSEQEVVDIQSWAMTTHLASSDNNVMISPEPIALMVATPEASRSELEQARLERELANRAVRFAAQAE
jgi:hypothetical protein